MSSIPKEEKYFIFCEEDEDMERVTAIVAKQVNEAIKDGWKPCGGVSVTSVKTTGLRVYVVAQAMTRI